MSGLSDLLVGDVARGAYRSHPSYDVGSVRATAEEAGWSFALLDGVLTVSELHDALVIALHFPDYYGRNLDALNDCLRDIEPRTVVLWEGWGEFAESEPWTFAVAVDLLGSVLVLLLSGDGPDVELPRLA